MRIIENRDSQPFRLPPPSDAQFLISPFEFVDLNGFGNCSSTILSQQNSNWVYQISETSWCEIIDQAKGHGFICLYYIDLCQTNS